jgi:hypothetical protein
MLRPDIHRKREEKKSRGCGPYRDNEFERNINMFKLGIHRKNLTPTRRTICVVQILQTSCLELYYICRSLNQGRGLRTTGFMNFNVTYFKPHVQ